MMVYSVNLQAGITESFFQDLKRLEENNVQVQKRLTEVMIELVQNILYHGSGIDKAFIKIYKLHDSYQIVSANTVKNNQLGKLESKVQAINSLTQEQLKETYQQRLMGQSDISERGGLGLYRIARRVTGHLNTTFRQRRQHHVTFELSVTLSA